MPILVSFLVLAKEISAGRLVDLALAYPVGAGVEPDVQVYAGRVRSVWA